MAHLIVAAYLLIIEDRTFTQLHRGEWSRYKAPHQPDEWRRMNDEVGLLSVQR